MRNRTGRIGEKPGKTKSSFRYQDEFAVGDSFRFSGDLPAPFSSSTLRRSSARDWLTFASPPLSESRQDKGFFSLGLGLGTIDAIISVVEAAVVLATLGGVG